VDEVCLVPGPIQAFLVFTGVIITFFPSRKILSSKGNIFAGGKNEPTHTTIGYILGT
jgi:hypothetical protein